ncbi:hypothetical protein BH09SUM1_BH09SUM1_23410 [soil metagenome]
MNMKRLGKLKTTWLLSGGLFLCASVAGAQGALRLGDLFEAEAVAPTPAPAISLEGMTQEKAAALLTQVQGEITAGNYANALPVTEALLAWLPKKTADYEEALYLRGRGYEHTEHNQKSIEITKIYTTDFPTGAHRSWFLLKAAEEAERQGESEKSATLWRMIAKDGAVLEPMSALKGAASLNRAGDGATARQLIAVAEKQSGATGGGQIFQSLHDQLLIESLLVDDDPKVAIPGSTDDDQSQLNAALLTDIRKGSRAAKPLYDAIPAESVQLTADERAILRSRATAAPAWPPAERVAPGK